MAFFSWPSKGLYKGYAADEAAVEAAEPALVNFLKNVAQRSGARCVHVVAHSMGNRAFLRSIHKIVASSASDVPTVKFGQVILAAPNVDSSVFQQLATLLTKVADRTTLYISDRDKALSFSAFLHDFPRAGYWPPITMVPGIDTVQVQNIDFTFLGHGYFAGLRQMLVDMHHLIQSGADPASRFGLSGAVSSNGQPYWVIRA
jgi:esterase/lipase superfamily enzyme